MISAKIFECFRFEQALNQMVSGVAVPYWDSVLDSDLPDPRDSVLFTPDYMGSAGGSVNGPFAGFPVYPNCQSFGATLERHANGSANWLYNDNDINYFEYAHSLFSDLANDPVIEFDHGGVYQFFTGHMSDLNCATADPLFYLHHSFVDCTFQHFLDNTIPPVTPNDYPAPAAGGPDHQAWAQMTPCLFINNRDGLDASRYQQYTCDQRPSSISCGSHSHCGNLDALWCDYRLALFKCRARVKTGGNCTGLPDDACQPCTSGFTAQCAGNVCQCTWTG